MRAGFGPLFCFEPTRSPGRPTSARATTAAPPLSAPLHRASRPCARRPQAATGTGHATQDAPAPVSGNADPAIPPFPHRSTPPAAAAHGAQAPPERPAARRWQHPTSATGWPPPKRSAAEPGAATDRGITAACRANAPAARPRPPQHAQRLNAGMTQLRLPAP